MRKLVSMKKWSVCLIALVAACSSPAENEPEADGNAAAAAPATDNAADSASDNATDGNAAVAAVEGNAAATDGTGDVYRASGSEPFWSLTVDEQMVFDAADGPDVTVATPPQQPTRAGYRYVTPAMTVTVNTFRRCTAASGQVHHDTVDVTVGGQAFSGCGGAVTASE